MARRIAHFSCGAASAIATKLSNPDEIWYAHTGGEDSDNERFMHDCEQWFGTKVRVIKSDKYASTWDLWESKKYLCGPKGAPCTGELKVKPLSAAELPGDIGIIGYTADPQDAKRVKQLQGIKPYAQWEFPLIERGIRKAECLAMLERVGIRPPRVYALGFHNANCIPCVKATSPRYWALMRRTFPEEFARMDAICKRIGAKPVIFSNKFNGEKWVKERGFPSDVPDETETQDPISPACDMLCAAMTAEFEI